jgi:alkylation response protein AidB-like acyl-CoA dehydrogenase
MDFTYTEIQTMLADSVGKFIDNEYDFDTRQAYAGSDKGYSEEVWSTFAELGWTAVPFSEDRTRSGCRALPGQCHSRRRHSQACGQPGAEGTVAAGNYRR